MRDSLKNKSALTYSFADGNGGIEVRWESYDAVERRHTYYCRVTADSNPLMQTSAETEVRSESGDRISLPRALATVLSFLSAFSESRRNGNPNSENWNLFPEHLANWAEAMADEFEMACEEIEPTA